MGLFDKIKKGFSNVSCPHCGAPNSASGKICMRCNKSLTSKPEPAAATVQPVKPTVPTPPQPAQPRQPEAVRSAIAPEVRYIATQTIYPGATALGNLAGQQKPFGIADQDRYSGMYVLGVQGVGKSSLLENLIAQDIAKGYSVIVIDPHGDLIDHVIAQLPQETEAAILSRLYLLDIEDTGYPFGLNLFAIRQDAPVIAQQQTHDRALHVFEKCFPETSHMLLEKYIGNIAPVFFANAQAGYSITDIPKFLRDDAFRNRLLGSKNVNYFIKSFWQEEYEAMSPSKRQGETASLATRLNRFVRSPIVGNIIGQGRNTIDFRAAIENREIILIKLPLKQLPQDAELIGTMLIAQIHAAIFSFADMPQEKRPGFSLYVDEFQHFATTDFSEMFTEGRKFGVRVTVAHQYRRQLPDYLESATMTARTKICFQCPEDSREMSHLFPGKAEIDMNSIPGDVVKYLIRNGHSHPQVSDLATSLLPFMQKNAQGKDGNLIGLTELNTLLVACMRDGNANQDIPANAMILLFQSIFDAIYDHITIEPFFRSGQHGIPNFYDPKPLFYMFCKPNVFDNRQQLKDMAVKGGMLIKQERRDAVDKVLGWLEVLRATMQELAVNPLGEAKVESPAEVANKLASLPRRTAFVRTGSAVATITTQTTPERVPPALFSSRVKRIQAATHTKYCKPASQVEQEIMQRLGAKEDGEVDVGATIGSVAGAEPEPMKIPKPETQIPQPAAKLEPEEQTAASKDTINILAASMRAKAIDPDTTILASLGEHYVMTIRQWMRLFAWGSYPRATSYFKELKEQEWIFHKDREGRGGKLVEGDWFFLLTKGANELVKRKQAAPLFRLEPNEAEKTSGDTLFHTYLVNEIFIHLRLLERARPEIVRIEQIDHERSMRRNYLAALADSKLYPDGFLRLLTPTRNGLKRKYMFLELQHTTQKDEANWKTKCRKYIALFERPDILEQFFSTRTPQVLVITMDTEYVAYHKEWTEEVLTEAGDRGLGYGNRFLVGAFDTGISDMTMPPQQFFCTPRFYTPFHDAPHAVFGT